MLVPLKNRLKLISHQHAQMLISHEKTVKVDFTSSVCKDVFFWLKEYNVDFMSTCNCKNFFHMRNIKILIS